jgi:hypothetical protein
MNDFERLDSMVDDPTGDPVTDALAHAYSADSLLMQLKEDKKKGLRTRELMEKYKLTWPQIRPLIESLTTPATRAAQKIRTAQIAADAAEAMAEKIADSVKLMDYDKMPNALKSMVDVANQLSGGPSQVIEVRHSIATDHESRANELAELRSKHKRMISGEVMEAELVESVSTNIDDY